MVSSSAGLLYCCKCRLALSLVVTYEKKPGLHIPGSMLLLSRCTGDPFGYGSRLAAVYAAVLSSVCAFGLPIAKYRLPQSPSCLVCEFGLLSSKNGRCMIVMQNAKRLTRVHTSYLKYVDTRGEPRQIIC